MPRALVTLSLLLFCACPAFAKVKVSADIGWNNHFRTGKWTPIYLTLSDSSPRQVDIELYAPADRRYALVVRQSLAIGPTPVTIALYAPLSYQLDESTIVVRDSNSNKRLESLPLSDYPAYRNDLAGPSLVPAQNLFIGISGSVNGERLVRSQFSQENISTSFLAQPRLPAVAVGYDALDLLILNQPDINRLTIEQQQAIADWVRAGGLLVMWPGPEPVPIFGPLLEILPASIGENRALDIPMEAIRAAGLPDRFAKLKGRALPKPASDAVPVPLLGGADSVGYRRWVGMGQVLMMPADLSQLQFHDANNSITFWRGILTGLVTVPAASDNNARHAFFEDDPRRSASMQQTLDWIGDIPGAGQFGFSWIAAVLIGMMLIVGPVDWFVLKWLGRQPWTWVTISGWIGLVTIGSIYIGHIFKSGEVHYRTASVIDEAGGARVAALDLAGIYSPRTTHYKLEMDAESWWRPASTSSYGGSGILTEIRCHQDYRGNRPLPLLINVWNLRFLQGEELTAAAPIVQAQLKRAGKRIEGTITNRGRTPLSRICVQTGGGAFALDGVIEPGASINVGHALNEGLTFLPVVPRDEKTDIAARYRHSSWSPTTRPTYQSLGGVADQRQTRIAQLLAERDDLACVFAEFEAPPPRVDLKDDQARRAHVSIVRAVVPLE